MTAVLQFCSALANRTVALGVFAILFIASITQIRRSQTAATEEGATPAAPADWAAAVQAEDSEATAVWAQEEPAREWGWGWRSW